MDGGTNLFLFLCLTLLGSWLGWAYTIGRAYAACEKLYNENVNLSGGENRRKVSEESAWARVKVLEERLASIRTITAEIEE